MRSIDKAVANAAKKSLLERVKPGELIEKEFRFQLTLRQLKLDDITPIRLDVSTKSQLEGFLWRDIEYFAEQEYTDLEVASRAIERLREKNVYKEALEDLVKQFSE